MKSILLAVATAGALIGGLIGAACGTLFSLTFANQWIERVGHRRTLLALVLGRA